MIHTLIKSLFAFCLLFFNTSSIAAEMTTLTPGTRVRITAPTLFTGQLIGTVVVVYADTLVIEHGTTAGFQHLKSGITPFPINKLSKLERNIGRKKDSAIVGGTLGVATGFGTIALLGKTVLSGQKSLALLYLAPGILAASTTLGIIIARKERWQKIPLESTRIAR